MSTPRSQAGTMSSGMPPTIFEALGGEAALTSVVNDLYGRVVADPMLAGFFAGANLTRIKGGTVGVFASLLGGPACCAQSRMREVHEGKGINRQHFNRVAGHLVESLDAAAVPVEIIAAFIEQIAPLASEIAPLASGAATS